MAIDVTKGENTIIKITLRGMIILITAIIGMYAWMFMTFLTKAEAGEITTLLSAHITEATLYRIDLDIDNNQDKLWLLRERMAEGENGSTSERRQKADEYTRRIDKLKERKECIHQGGSIC